MTKQGALEELIKSMFNDAELRSFLGKMAKTASLLAGLPGGSASPQRVMFETVGLLDRNRVIDSEFFEALSVVRPRLRQEIQKVAAMWGLTLPARDVRVATASGSTPGSASTSSLPLTPMPASTAGPTTLPADVAILIALTEEWEVFWPIAGEPGGVKDDSGGYLYYFDVPGLGRPYRCVSLFMGAMGPGQAMHATTRLLAAKPKSVVNLGIAAAIHSDLKLCDVVVAEQVDDFLSTVKAVPKGKDGWTFEARGSVYRATHALVQDLVNLKFAHRDTFMRWRSMCAPAMAERAGQLGAALAAKHIRDAPVIMNVHLASGPVLAAAESFSKWIRTRDGLLKALEMEAAGMMLAAHQQADPARTLVLRGISDFGDERKSQTDRDSGGAFRYLAMLNATQLLWAMMQQGLLPRHEPTSGGPTGGARSSSISDAAHHARAVKAAPDSERSAPELDSVQAGAADDDGAATARQAAKVAAANAEVDRMLEKDEPGVWGLQAADRERQALVDAALDRCTDTSFCALVRVIAQPRRTSLGLVGAHEALFAAAARRLSRDNFNVPSADLPAWHQLVELQIASLVLSGIARHPYTRQGEHFDAWDTFWADGWTFSLRIPAPPKFDHPDLVWYFPGWAKQLDASPMPQHWPSSSKGVRRMVIMAFEVLPKLINEPPSIDLPRLLLPAMIILAPSRGWQLTAKLLSALSGSWEERTLAQMVVKRPPDERTRLADVLWDILPFTFNPEPKMPVTQRLRRLESSSRRLLPFIVANLSEAALSRTIISDGVGEGHEVASLLLLPRPLRHVCARAVLTAAPGDISDWHTARTIASIFDSKNDADFLIDIIQKSDANVAAEFTAFVWRVAPDRAVDEAEEAFVHGRASAHGWFFYAPHTDLPRLLQVVEESPGPLPPWMPEWAKRRALDGGPCSEMLFGLAHAKQDRGSNKQPAVTPSSAAPPPVAASKPAVPLPSAATPKHVLSPAEPRPTSASAAVPPRPLAAPTPVPAGQEWLLAFENPGVRDLFAHLAHHGIVTEDQASRMLGGPRALRTFSRELEAHVQKAPFSVSIDNVGGVKRYVREGQKS